MQLKRATLSAQIADVVRADIVFGRIPAGTKLGQRELCERFSTSRMPARDALRQLAHEGLVVPDGAGHQMVESLSRRDIEDAYVIEGALQGLAARRVAEHSSPEVLAELRRRHEEMQDAEDDPGRLGELNWDFHRRITELADSPKLATALRATAMRMPTNAIYLEQFPEWCSHVNAEHEEILQAIAGGDGDRAEQLMRSHVADAGYHLAKYLSEHHGAAAG
jgi:DNA-binding GntR family transcriptional regulator